MRSKAIGYVCGMCGARLGGVGDWIAHVCPDVPGNTPAHFLHRRGPKYRAPVTDPHGQDLSGNRITLVPESLPKTFEDLLTPEDRVWMREMENAFAPL
jgi:hypothetical protein